MEDTCVLNKVALHSSKHIIPGPRGPHLGQEPDKSHMSSPVDLFWLLECREARGTPVEGHLSPFSVHPYLAGMMTTSSAARIAVEDIDIKPNT